MTTRRLPILVATAFGLLAVPLLAAESIRVTPLARDGKLLVSFELAEGFSEEVRAAIRSGLATTFTYDIELRRGVPFWVDRTIAAATVEASVLYDNLTRRHQLSRAVNGRIEPDAIVTEQEDFVRRWLTTFERLPLFSTAGLETHDEYYVRVRVRTRPRTSWALLPWGGGAASGQAKFTFIP